MRLSHLNDYTRGWIIGHFNNSVLQTTDFEVGILTHKQGEDWPKHYHKESTEYNVLLYGEMVLQFIDRPAEFINAGTVFVIEKGEVVKPIFLEDCTVLCVKVPSVPGDKYVV